MRMSFPRLNGSSRIRGRQVRSSRLVRMAVALAPRTCRERIPFVRPHPLGAQAAHCRMTGVLDDARRLPELRADRVADELGPDQIVDIPSPRIFEGPARAVWPDETAPLFQPGSEAFPLRSGQHVSADTIPDHDSKTLQLLRIEDSSVFRNKDRLTMFGGDTARCGVRSPYLSVLSIAVGLRENQERLTI